MTCGEAGYVTSSLVCMTALSSYHPRPPYNPPHSPTLPLSQVTSPSSSSLPQSAVLFLTPAHHQPFFPHSPCHPFPPVSREATVRVPLTAPGRPGVCHYSTNIHTNGPTLTTRVHPSAFSVEMCCPSNMLAALKLTACSSMGHGISTHGKRKKIPTNLGSINHLRSRMWEADIRACVAEGGNLTTAGKAL